MPEQFPERDPIEEITDRLAADEISTEEAAMQMLGAWGITPRASLRHRLGEVDWLHSIRRGAIWAGRGNISYLWGCILTDAVTDGAVPTEAYAVGGGLSVLTCGTYFAVDALQRRQERRHA